MIILDRYEKNFAILEIEGEIKKLPLDVFDKNIPEGSVVKFSGGKYFLDEEETEKRRKKLLDLQNSLFDD